MNYLKRILTLSKLRRALRAIKYFIQAVAIFKRDLWPHIEIYWQNVALLIKQLRETELLEEKII